MGVINMEKVNKVSVMECLGFYTQIKKSDLKILINHAPLSYRIFYIEKKSSNKLKSNQRQICQPTIKTKMLQYALLNYFFIDLEENNCAMAYIRGKKKPTYENASRHKSFLYTVHYDFSDFFYSITSDVFFRSIENDFSFTGDEIEIIKKICFIKYKNEFRLAIGSPISPKFCNLYMREFDQLLANFAHTNNESYTRYADDILYSTNNKKNISSFKNKLDEILKLDKYANLKINSYKTKIFRPKAAKRITGLIVTPDGKIKVPRKLKREVRSLIYKSNTLDDIEKQRLQGLIAYIKDVEPSYINSLISKYKKQYFNCI